MGLNVTVKRVGFLELVASNWYFLLWVFCRYRLGGALDG